ncbi:glycosyltransferase [Devosia sp.]|uniref:glycosyltransferase n=1 Tax=Devosia sp. TaxID=1871048 RepID=UPI0035B20A4D
MSRGSISLNGRSVSIAHPEELSADLRLILGDLQPIDPEGAADLRLTASGSDRYGLEGLGDPLVGLDRPSLLTHVVDRVIRGLIGEVGSDPALHAGLVSLGDGAALIAGPTGAGKSSLAAWLASRGLRLWTDELVVLAAGGRELVPLRRALVGKAGTTAILAELPPFRGKRQVAMAGGVAYDTDAPAGTPPSAVRLVLLPHFEAGAALTVRALRPAQAGFRLMACNLNARNFVDGGLNAISTAMAGALCLEVTYSHFDQLDGAFETLARLALEGKVGADVAASLLQLGGAAPTATSVPAAPRPVPAATPAGRPRRLTVAMTTYDDFDGVYFSVQALRMFHGEAIGDAEILVIDNNPDGIAAQALKDLETGIPNYRYVPFLERRGTIVRDSVFDLAVGEYVICMDCHVMFVPGSIGRLMAYFDAHPQTRDLLQGPLIYDNLSGISTHFEPEWHGGMWGRWATDPRGADPDAEPFDIPMQGVGALACRRDAWPGYNRMFRGFGAEEGYIHEKFRQGGARTLCLPFFRWLHRFPRPRGVSYPNRWEDRVFNIIAGFNELGLPAEEMTQHFRELLGQSEADRLIADAWRELQMAGVPIGAARSRRLAAAG